MDSVLKIWVAPWVGRVGQGHGAQVEAQETDGSVGSRVGKPGSPMTSVSRSAFSRHTTH